MARAQALTPALVRACLCLVQAALLSPGRGSMVVDPLLCRDMRKRLPSHRRSAALLGACRPLWSSHATTHFADLEVTMYSTTPKPLGRRIVLDTFLPARHLVDPLRHLPSFLHLYQGALPSLGLRVPWVLSRARLLPVAQMPAVGETAFLEVVLPCRQLVAAAVADVGASPLAIFCRRRPRTQPLPHRLGSHFPRAVAFQGVVAVMVFVAFVAGVAVVAGVAGVAVLP